MKDLSSVKRAFDKTLALSAARLVLVGVRVRLVDFAP
jgi:hypothetical protein